MKKIFIYTNILILLAVSFSACKKQLIKIT
jgi:hypothetical protein